VNSSSSLVGATLGRYLLLEKIGQGGMATVYRADDPTLGRQVAVKVMHPFIAADSEAGSRFEREAQSVATLRHPNVLQLHDYAPASAEQPAYLVMELLTGPSLHHFVAADGKPPAEIAAIIGLHIAEALAAAHAHGIVHRDVKPENVMFDGGRVVLCDFGIARVAAFSAMTATGAVLGSPAYMSPEQALSDELDGRSDQFSLGSLLYQLATGVPPFAGATPLATMALVARGEHVLPSTRNPHLPAYLERVIERCLRVAPEARFASAEECAHALRTGLVAGGCVDLELELARYLSAPADYAAAAAARSAPAPATRPRLRWRAIGALTVVAAIALALGARALSRPTRTTVTPQLPRAAQPAHDTATPPTVSAALSTPIAPSVGASARSATTTAGEPATETKRPAGTDRSRRRPPVTKRTTEAVTPLPPIASPEPPPAIAAAAPATTTPPAAAPLPAAPTLAWLTVATSPWCDLRVDGVARGRTPQRLSLPPGRHHIDCNNPAAGHAMSTDVTLGAGEEKVIKRPLFAPVRVIPQLVEAQVFAIDGNPVVGIATVMPGPHRITLYRDRRVIADQYIDVPFESCLLYDKPQIRCEKGE
jgi:tRNA A-37 threonylcarbamoyl transferase component Bud32